MICPVCKEERLEVKVLAEQLKVFGCMVCGGNWVRHEDYLKFGSVNTISNEKTTGKNLPVADSKQANICPDCGRILIKYRVDNKLDFYVDHCGNCNGVWLDRNEWENLCMNNLHYQINSFFTKPWQKKLRDEAAKNSLKDKYIRKFGRWDYERLKEMREWIYKNEKKNEMLSYLIDEDPYKI